MIPKSLSPSFAKIVSDRLPNMFEHANGKMKRFGVTKDQCPRVSYSTQEVDPLLKRGGDCRSFFHFV